jgi:MFS family permease
VAGAVLNPINSTLIAVALVPIGRSFGAGPGQTAWLISALYLATAVGQPVVGLLVDRYGARRILLGGAVLVIAAGIAGMIPLSVGWLTGVRVVLGLGTCAGFPAAMAVLRHHAESSGAGRRVPARVLSLLSMSSQTVMVIGPTLGGLLIGRFGWPAIFAVNIPLATLSLVLALLWVPKDDRGARTAAPIDVLGIVLFSATLLALLFFLMDPGADGWLLAVVAAFAVAFALVELRRADPFLDLRMLAANGAILRTYLRQALSFMAIYAIMFGYVQWLETARHLSEEAAGLMLLPMSGTAVCAAAFSGRGTGIKARLVTVAVALIGGSVLLLFVHDGTGIGALLALAALFGLAQGLTSVANQTTLYQEAPAGQMGTASGLFRTAQYLGAIVASTLIALCYGPHADSAGLHRLAIALVAISAALLVVTVIDRGLRARA